MLKHLKQALTVPRTKTKMM